MGENEEKSLALELLQEVKIQSKRWMWAFFAVLIAWVLTIAAFLLIPDEEIVMDSGQGGYANYVGNDLGGTIYNGEGYSQEAEQAQEENSN